MFRPLDYLFLMAMDKCSNFFTHGLMFEREAYTSASANIRLSR